MLILIASIGISFYLSAQSAGDYRSIANGNWNDVKNGKYLMAIVGLLPQPTWIKIPERGQLLLPISL